MTAPGGEAGGVQSVFTALAVLETFSSMEPLGVTEVARRLGMPKSSTQRYLTTLGSAGWLSVTPNSPVRWTLGPRAISLGFRAMDGLELRQIVHPLLEELRHSTDESVLLSVPTPRGALVIDRIESDQPVRSVIGLGAYLPYHASAAGLAMLSTFSEQRVVSLLEELPPSAYTDHTLTNANEIIQSLSTIRDQNFAINYEYFGDGVSGFGSSILSRDGEAIAALSVSIPTTRFVKEKAIEHAKTLAARVKPLHGLLS